MHRRPPIEGVTPPAQPFAKFAASLDYLTDFKGYKSYIVGGGTNNFFWHTPKYAVAQFCPTEPNTPAGAAPACDPLQDKSFAILSYNFGSLRQPVVFQFWIPSVLLVRSVAARPALVRAGRAQEQEGRARPGARPDTERLGGRCMVLAQQLIDASKDGGAAFLSFAIMVFLFVGSLFYMDHIRKRREEQNR